LNEADVARDLGFERAGIAARDIYARSRDTDVLTGTEGSGSRATRKMTPQEAYNAIPWSILEDMKPSERMALQERRDADSANKSNPGNTNLFNWIMRGIRSNPEEWEFKDLEQYVFPDGGLNIAQRNLADKYRREPPAARFKDSELYDRFYNQMGIDIEAAKEQGTDDYERANAYDWWVGNNIPENASPREKQEVMERGAIEIVSRYDTVTPSETYFAYEAGADKLSTPGGGVDVRYVDELAQMIRDIGIEEVNNDLIRYANLMLDQGKWDLEDPEETKKNLLAFVREMGGITGLGHNLAHGEAPVFKGRSASAKSRASKEPEAERQRPRNPRYQ
jgi:hypothetical protein